MFFLQSRGPFQDGLSPVLGSSEESESINCRGCQQNKVKQDLATKEIERQLKQEIERQKMNETLSMTRPEPETGENLTGGSN